jgi:hypothetical protein
VVSFERLECRWLFAAGLIELGPSDNIALDQPRVAVEFAVDADAGPDVRWESIGPGLFNTFLLDTGASSVLAMATAVADMEQTRLGYDVQGALLESGVAGDHLLDVSIPYRFDFAGSNGIRHTLLDSRIMSDAANDFSSFGPWGLAGMPAMVNRVTSLDFTGWSGGGLDLDSIYMGTEFREDVPASNGHRYTIPLDNRLAFDPLDQMVFGQPPIWGDVPFLTALPEHRGVAQSGNFLFDTGAQISVLSERLAIDIGLDSNGDGLLDHNDENFVTTQVVGGVGGQISVPVFGFDELNVITESGEALVWTNLEWLVLDISVPGQDVTLDGVFGSDLLTSGWFHAFFSPGQPDGYINQVHMDFREMATLGTGKLHLDLNPDVDHVILPGPGIIVRQSFRTTDVGEGGQTDSYDIVLTGQPTADVVISIENSAGQVTAVNAVDGTSTLVFTPQNWDTVQTVLVTAVNDLAAEGNHDTQISHSVQSADAGYDGRVISDVRVRVTDDDLNLLRITSDQAGQNRLDSVDLIEGSGNAYYWVALNSQPENETWVLAEDTRQQAQAVKADNPQLGLENVLMFNAGNWSIPQRVAVQAVDDALREGSHSTTMVHTVLDVVQFSDPIIGQTPLPIHITDDDLAVVAITPSDGSTDLSEGGSTDSYQISLNLLPSASVQIAIHADDQTRISVDGGATFAATQMLTFNDVGPKTVVIQAVDDAVAEEIHTGVITHSVVGTSSDLRFPDTLSIPDMIASIGDNDTAGLNIQLTPPIEQGEPVALAASESSGNGPESSIEIIEQGDSRTYWIALKSQPRDEVTVVLRGTHEQLIAYDASQPANDFVTFNVDNWDSPRAVRATAVDDSVVEGIHDEMLVHHTISADPSYHGSLLVPVTIVDNDLAEFGDAPTPYPTLAGDDGAFHLAVGSFLGAKRDTEIDGSPSTVANGDDGADFLSSDEDGVQFGGLQVGATIAAVNVFLQSGSSGKVDAWIDFDRDGTWEPAEKILDSISVNQTLQTLNFLLPQGVGEGAAYARVRLSSAGSLEPTGPAPDGEVEDYLVHLVTAPTVESVVINQGSPQRSSIDSVTLMFDRVVDISQVSGDPFQFINADTGQVVTAAAMISQQQNKTVVEFSFPFGPSVTAGGSLADGNYRLVIDAPMIRYHSVVLDGNKDGMAGDSHSFGADSADAFFRNYGDVNGNGVVDLIDFAEFRRTFGQSAGSVGYRRGLDADGDDTIGLLDFAEFRRHFGT